MSKKTDIQERIDRGLQDLYALFDGLFPVLLFVYDDRQRTAVLYLLKNTLSISYKTEDICLWCALHHIEYEVFISRRDRLLPWRRLAYRRVMRRIGGDMS